MTIEMNSISLRDHRVIDTVDCLHERSDCIRVGNDENTFALLHTGSDDVLPVPKGSILTLFQGLGLGDVVLVLSLHLENAWQRRNSCIKLKLMVAENIRGIPSAERVWTLPAQRMTRIDSSMCPAYSCMRSPRRK